jgi:hypothetical protein
MVVASMVALITRITASGSSKTVLCVAFTNSLRICVHSHRMLCSGRNLIRPQSIRVTSTSVKRLVCGNKSQHATRSRPKKVAEMKRKEPPSTEKSTAKRARPQIPEYHETPSVKEEDGTIQWPAPKRQMEEAREIILEW